MATNFKPIESQFPIDHQHFKLGIQFGNTKALKCLLKEGKTGKKKKCSDEFVSLTSKSIVPYLN